MKISDLLSDVDDYSSDTNDEYSSDSNDDLSSISSESSENYESSENDESSDESAIPRARSESEAIRTILAASLEHYLRLPGPRLSLRGTNVSKLLNIIRCNELRNIRLDLLEKYVMYTNCPLVDILILLASIGNVTYLLEKMMTRLPVEYVIVLRASDIYEQMTSYTKYEEYLMSILSTPGSQEEGPRCKRLFDKVRREYKKMKKELRMYDREVRRCLRRRQ